MFIWLSRREPNKHPRFLHHRVFAPDPFSPLNRVFAQLHAAVPCHDTTTSTHSARESLHPGSLCVHFDFMITGADCSTPLSRRNPHCGLDFPEYNHAFLYTERSEYRRTGCKVPDPELPG